MSSDTDTESSCGWTIISNEGSDIETLGSEAVEPATENSEPHTATISHAESELKEDSLEVTLVDASTEQAVDPAEAEACAEGREQVSVLSSSDHSDILTLGDLKEDESIPAETSEDFYMGMSCSSQYTFNAAETVLPVQPSVAPDSSSSDDESDPSPGAGVRRRRVRRNTANVTAELERDEETDAAPSEREDGREQSPHRGQAKPNSSSALNTCILITLIVAISMSYGHFYGTTQIQERQKYVDKLKLNELDGLRDLIYHTREQGGELDLNDLDVQKAVPVLLEVMNKMRKENEELRVQHEQTQLQNEDLKVRLKAKSEEKHKIESQHQILLIENYQLQHLLEDKKKSLLVVQEELRTLRYKIQDLEAVRAGADALISENQILKIALEEEKETIRRFSRRREGLMAEAQTLREKLDKEKGVTEELRREIDKLRQQISGAEKAKELQSRLAELEKRLSFEQQRSDLWERLYLETKEERAKGDSESKPRKSKPKGTMAGKVKETFDAVKNSTKEFVHHHKEQIKKAKQAVKENLRKFSDSVKSTFRNFKDSASTIFNKARGFYTKEDGKNRQETWQHRSGRPTQQRQFKCDSFQSNHCSRKSADGVYEEPPQQDHKFKPKSCSGVFECAYQESMSLFNKAIDPIRADEFYQLLQSYLQQEVDHFPHWKELERFIKNFFHNGLFIHDQMLFTDFVNEVEDYLTDMYKYQGLNEDFFDDLEGYIYKHFFGETNSKTFRPSGPFMRPDSKEDVREKHRRKQQRSRRSSERKWSRSDQNKDRHMADVKIELGPMPFDPKY